MKNLRMKDFTVNIYNISMTINKLAFKKNNMR